jgi:hypothetical protein
VSDQDHDIDRDAGETLARKSDAPLVARGAVATTRRRHRIALAVAATSDIAQVVFAPLFVEGAGSPFEVALDAVTAAVILFIVGFRWRLALALAAELIPGADLFPTWTAVVLSLPRDR